MSRYHTPSIPNEFVRNFKTSLFVALFLSQQLMYNDRYLVSAAIPSGSQSSPSNSMPEKIGVSMERQPESTIAPLYDEVLFECSLNLVPDRIEWRFRPQKQRANSINGFSEFTRLTKTVRIFKFFSISIDLEIIQKMKMFFSLLFLSEWIQYIDWWQFFQIASVCKSRVRRRISMRCMAWTRCISIHTGKAYFGWY